MKQVFASNLKLTDFVRADAGVQEAVFESRLAAVYTAVYHVLHSGNKTQINMLGTACEQFKDVKACKEAMGEPRVTAAVKRMQAVYLAYGAAMPVIAGLSGLTMPRKTADDKIALDAACEAQATALAGEFVTIVQTALMPEVKPAKTEAEQAKAKADKEAKTQQAKAELEQAIKTEAAKLADANAVTLADMVRSVANAIRMGMLDGDALALLDSALDSVAANVELIPVHAEQGETLAA